MSSEGPTLDDRIQSLLGAASFEELRSSLVPILHELSYRATMVDGGAEALNQWREECTECLYRETVQDAAARPLAAPDRAGEDSDGGEDEQQGAGC